MREAADRIRNSWEILADQGPPSRTTIHQWFDRMPLNIPALLAPLHVLFRPRILVPSIVAQDVRQLNFEALYISGYRGIVFDKDNCLTRPYEDSLVPELKEAWRDCRTVFGNSNVLIVSNSAGTRADSGDISAEAVTHSLGVPVLRHRCLKPSRSCAAQIVAYFASLPHGPVRPSQLVIVGDRIITDVVLSNRMRNMRGRQLARLLASKSRNEDDKGGKEGVDSVAKPTSEEGAAEDPNGPLAVFTTRLWVRDNTLFRLLEGGMLRVVERLVLSEQEREARRQREARFLRDRVS